MVLKYSTSAELNRVEYEFLEYQLLQEATIPKTLWQAVLVVDGETHHHRNHSQDSVAGCPGGRRRNSPSQDGCHLVSPDEDEGPQRVPNV